MSRAAAAASFLLLIAAAPLHAVDALLVARGQWAAFADRRIGSCRAVARSERIVRRGRPQPMASLRFDRSGRRRGELAIQLSRAVRPGSSVILTIGDQPFQLLARDRLAWSSGPRQESAIIAAMRAAQAMRASARDRAGRYFSDRFLLDGAPTAIDAAAAACAPRR